MEMKLASELGVSRTPVREAIHMLEREDLVRQEAHRGVVVTGITLKRLRDVLEVRGMLEVLAVELACRRAQEEDFTRLEEAETSFVGAVRGEAPIQELAARDVAFHDIIYGMTENEKLMQVVADLRQQMYRYRIEYLKDKKLRLGLIEEHREIARALRARDEKTAVRIARLHIANQEEAIASRLTRENPV